MKDVKIADIRAESADQLKDRLVGLKKEQFNLRFQRAAGQLESTSRVRQVRREIARVKTVLGQPEGQVVKAPAAKKPASAKTVSKVAETKPAKAEKAPAKKAPANTAAAKGKK